MNEKKPPRAAALITGAAKRLGLAIARNAAANGLDIALHYHQSSAVAHESAAAIERDFGVTCTPFSADLSSPTAADDLIHKVVDHYPHLQVLVNSASVFTASEIVTETDEFIQHTLQTNLLSPWQLTRACARYWQTLEKPSTTNLIVNLTDQRITHAASGHFAYNISKRALDALTEIAALELAPHIRVNAIAPGVILAPPEIDEPSEVAEFLRQKGACVPLQQAGSGDDIAQAFNYLLNNEFVTGQTLFVAGGEQL